MKKKTVVIHSGGMDSSLCLALAISEFGRDRVLSLSFSYGQRHSVELDRADAICRQWGVDHAVLNIDCLNQITENSLTRHDMKIEKGQAGAPNSLVVGRNGLMARIGAIQANSLGAGSIYLGVMELESANSGYRDCSRRYMNMQQEILRLDLADPNFEIRTPLVFLNKEETMDLGNRLGVLKFLLEESISCYNGIGKVGCRECPACQLRNEGIQRFLKRNPEFQFSYRDQFAI